MIDNKIIVISTDKSFVSDITHNYTNDMIKSINKIDFWDTSNEIYFMNCNKFIILTETLNIIDNWILIIKRLCVKSNVLLVYKNLKYEDVLFKIRKLNGGTVNILWCHYNNVLNKIPLLFSKK